MIFSLLVFLLMLSGCQITHIDETISPTVVCIPSKNLLEQLSSAFPPLTSEEKALPWGQEMHIALLFAREFDLYRAITTYKRALFLVPPIERTLEIEYGIILSYYLGQKYEELIDFFEHSHLTNVPPNFPAVLDLLTMLQDSYRHIGKEERADCLLTIVEKISSEHALRLKKSQAILNADFVTLSDLSMEDPLLEQYHTSKKSIQKARILNALLPGAGYLYVGQRQTALTSFLINGLFIAAAYTFFDRGYIAAGVITTSLEAGWYFGGINGAGLAVKEYNERTYEALSKDSLLRQRLFPILMLQYAF